MLKRISIPARVRPFLSMIKCKSKHQTQSSLFKQSTSRPTACLGQQPVGPERCRVYYESRVWECCVIVWDDHLGKTSTINIEHRSARGEWWYNSCASFHIVKDSCVRDIRGMNRKHLKATPKAKSTRLHHNHNAHVEHFEGPKACEGICMLIHQVLFNTQFLKQVCSKFLKRKVYMCTYKLYLHVYIHIYHVLNSD